MPLTIGSQLGSHEITALLGKGGMGEVYRARDLKLKREVAIKILPEEFSLDADRVSRFQREAEVLASLNHPNIAAIHDLQETDGTRYLVLELVEGETLADRIARGPIPIEEALSIAKQICEALEAAHERGIIHRDLKPANIKLTPDGKVKVLDFGLAKAMESAPANAMASNSPTLLSGTMGAVLIGTAAYMSPEQARGKPVDKRADIWAFGVVFHEMLTGRRVFAGEDITSTLAKVIEAQPSWQGVPPKVDRVLKKCLEKDPKKRLRDIGDVWELMENTPPTAPARSRFGTVAAGIVASIAIVIAGAVGYGWWRASRPVEQPLVRLDVDLGEDVALFHNSTGNSIIISPDGMRFVYLSALSGSEPKLFTRRLDQPKAIELAGTQGARAPFFSPDGQWIGFCAGNKTNKVSVEGGPVVPLVDAAAGCGAGGASWGEDGNIAIARGPQSMVIARAGGAPKAAIERVGELSAPENAGIDVYSPQILPGGKAILFTSRLRTVDSDSNISSVSLLDRKMKSLGPGTSARYSPSGHLIYTSKSTLFAVPFDLEKLETRGNPVAILDDVAYRRANGLAQFDISPAGHGILVYWRGGAIGNAPDGGNFTIQYMTNSGKRRPLIADPGTYNDLRLSPDGKRLVAIDGKQDVWVYDLQRDIRNRLTTDGKHSSAIWGPDGRYVIFDSDKGLSWVRADGASPAPQLLMPSENNPVPSSYSQVGKRLAYFGRPPAQEIWTVPLEEQNGQLKLGKPEQFLDSQLSGVAPEFSPDGRWLAYESSGQEAASGRGRGSRRGQGFGRARGAREVIVRPFPRPAAGQERQVLISNSGRFAHWSQSGQELFYQSGDQIMAVSYTVNGNEFVPGKARVWTSGLGTGSPFRPWDMTPDAKGLVVTTRINTPEPPKEDPVHTVVILQNFFDELRRRSPIGK